MEKLTSDEVTKKINEMRRKLVMNHVAKRYDEEIISDIDYINELLELATKYNKEDMIDYLTLTLDEFRAVKNKYYKGILKECKISLFWNHLDEIALEELQELKHKYKINYISIKDLYSTDSRSQIISLNLVYKYKKIILKIINDIDDKFLTDHSNREKIIFGIILGKIFERSNYDLNAEGKYINNIFNKIFNPNLYAPSNEIVLALTGKGVCRGLAGFIRDICRHLNTIYHLNIKCNIVAGSDGEYGHAWNQVCLDGEWFNMDATWDLEPITKLGKSYWLFMNDFDFDYGYQITNNTTGLLQEWSHRDFQNRQYLTDDYHECKTTLAQEELLKYIDIDNIRKRYWLNHCLEKTTLEQVRTIVNKLFSNVNEEKQNKKSKVKI